MAHPVTQDADLDLFFTEILACEGPFPRNINEPPHPLLDDAIIQGDVERAQTELLLLRKTHPSAIFDAALTLAITQDHEPIVSCLLDQGVTATEDHLKAALKQGRIAIVQHLMSHLSLPVNCTLRDGTTPLTLAVKHEASFEWLLAHDADVNLQDGWSESPLSRAIESGPPEVIQRLLDVGAEVERGSVLSMAILRGRLSGSDVHGLMEQLIRCGAPVNKYEGEQSALWDFSAFEKRTPLHRACAAENVACVKLLISHHADPTLNIRVGSSDIPSTSALDVARRENRADLIALIVPN